jgi:hypothetical protein
VSAEIPVYFTCPTCGLLYLVKQVRSFEGAPGRISISCVRCAAVVHSWSGTYDFRLWKPIHLTGTVNEA